MSTGKTRHPRLRPRPEPDITASVPAKTKQPTRRIMPSTLRCLQVLDVVAHEPNSFTFNEIVESAGMEKSSVHRFIQTLVAAGLLEFDPANRRYHVAGKALWIGSGYLRYSPVYRVAFPELEALAHATKAMTHLGVWDSDRVLYARLQAVVRQCWGTSPAALHGAWKDDACL